MDILKVETATGETLDVKLDENAGTGKGRSFLSIPQDQIKVDFIPSIISQLPPDTPITVMEDVWVLDFKPNQGK